MKALGLLLVAFAVGGCGSAPVTTTSKGTFALATLQDSEMDAIAGGAYPQGGNEVLITSRLQDFNGPGLYEELARRNLSMKSNFMKNPGVRVALIDAKPGEQMSEEDAQAMIELAEKLGHTASKRIKVDRVYGPDGRTPLVMADTATVIVSPSKERITGVRTTMVFPSEKAAKEAMQYIDPKTYTCTLEPAAPSRKARVIAEIIAPRQGQGPDEWGAFGPLAKQFGGEVEHVEASSEGTLID